MGASTIAIAITAAERRLMRRLRAAGARSAATAQPLPELRMIEARRLEHLKDAGAIREAEPGRYWVDDEAYAAYRGDRRALALALMVLSVGAVLLLTLFR